MSDELEQIAERMAAAVDARLDGTAVAVVEAPEIADAPSPIVAYQAMAYDEAGLQAAQAKMLLWADAQQRLCEAELVEEREAWRIAKERRWAVVRYAKNIKTLTERVTFYAKLHDALKGGYVIVPNFEMDVFAIRVDADANAPSQQLVVNSRAGANVTPSQREAFRQPPQQLPSGEGKYVNPKPSVFRTQRPVYSAEKKEFVSTQVVISSGWNHLDFPAALAKPVLMERVAEAQIAKVFDEIGVAVDSSREAARGGRKGDPILLGRIRNPRRNKPDVTFFLGWFFDPSNV